MPNNSYCLNSFGLFFSRFYKKDVETKLFIQRPLIQTCNSYLEPVCTTEGVFQLRYTSPKVVDFVQVEESEDQFHIDFKVIFTFF